MNSNDEEEDRHVLEGVMDYANNPILVQKSGPTVVVRGAYIASSRCAACGAIWLR